MSRLLFYIGSVVLRIIGCRLSSNWILIWIWIELKRLALIPILRIKVAPRSIEATRKYFLFQAIGRAMLLFGILLRRRKTDGLLILGSYKTFELIIFTFALTIKMGMFPNHFWFIDVMQGLNFIRGFFVAIISKIIPIYLIFIMRGTQRLNIFTILGIFSIVIGSVFGVQQTQLRKLIALSSVAHLGWMIIIFSSTNKNWLGGILFLSYVIMVMPLFWIGKNFSIEYLTKTIKIRNKVVLSLMICLTLLSIAGFPPLLGFFYKWIMFYVIAQTRKYLIITILIIASLISLYFYIQICLRVYINSWPVIKVLFEGKYLKKIKKTFVTWFIIFVNLFLYYLFWLISPVSSLWKL